VKKKKKKKKRMERDEGRDENDDKNENDDDILHRMLIGPPINSNRPCVEEIDALLSRHLAALPELIRNTYGNKTEATLEAAKDCASIANLPCSAEGVNCKRAALLFALRREPELREYFRKHDKSQPNFTIDLVDRVLPFLDPEFVKHSCQAPEAYVVTAAIFSQLFEGERLGNWPLLTTTAPLGC
jgi:hypothetical protein